MFGNSIFETHFSKLSFINSHYKVNFTNFTFWNSLFRIHLWTTLSEIHISNWSLIFLNKLFEIYFLKLTIHLQNSQKVNVLMILIHEIHLRWEKISINHSIWSNMNWLTKKLRSLCYCNYMHGPLSWEVPSLCTVLWQPRKKLDSLNKPSTYSWGHVPTNFAVYVHKPSVKIRSVNC